MAELEHGYSLDDFLSAHEALDVHDQLAAKANEPREGSQ